MLQSNELWATRYCSTNDSSEFSYGYNLLKQEMLHGAYFSSTAQRDRVLKKFLTQIEDVHKPNPFITSFTSAHDSLMHWREYARDTNGAMLELRSAELRSNLIAYGAGSTPHAYPIFLQKVTYDKARQSEAIKRYCEVLCPTLETYFKELPSDEKRRTFELMKGLPYFAGRIYTFCTSFKHPSFYYEDEVRLSFILLSASIDINKVTFGIRDAFTFERPEGRKPYFKIFRSSAARCDQPTQESGAKTQLGYTKVGLGVGCNENDRNLITNALIESNRDTSLLFNSSLPYRPSMQKASA